MQNEIIAKLISYVESECSAVDQEKQYDDMLDEIYSFDSVGGPFGSMSPSRVLKEVDPIAYRCGMNDYYGTDDSYVEIGSALYEKREVEKARDSFLDELDSEMSDLDSEIDDAKAEEEPNEAEIASAERRLLELKAEYEEAKQYTF